MCGSSSGKKNQVKLCKNKEGVRSIQSRVFVNVYDLRGFCSPERRHLFENDDDYLTTRHLAPLYIPSLCAFPTCNSFSNYAFFSLSFCCSTPFNVDNNRPGNSPLNHPDTIRMTPGKRGPVSFAQRMFSGPELLTTLTVISTLVGVSVGLLLRFIFPEKS